MHEIHSDLALIMSGGTGDCCEVLDLIKKNLPDPAEHATLSRDYGRGYAQAIRDVKELLQ